MPATALYTGSSAVRGKDLCAVNNTVFSSHSNCVWH
jgi:hypothetical protein